MKLYEEFLEKHSGHEFAPRAARRAHDLLVRTKQDDRAEAFRKKYESWITSVKPGINSPFLDPKLDVQSFVDRFEGESREIFVHRAKILALMGLKEGMRVADVGAGTGLFTWPISRKVGKEGGVFAVEISEGMLEHLTKEKERRSADNVHLVACTERSTMLPPASVDLVFVCDTYHHFEYPAETLASIHAALKPGGALVIVDFERIPGKSREWTLGHVRAGKEEVRKEIEAAGFRFVREEKTPLEENYTVRFEKVAG
ncbi:MAG: class I SAM-dependent methyltransferase [Planctomycetes bacterium]|nr:class I SAM-dependent methyltransferase [Planctomycetota bacterium]MCB9920371.1 class I SAM-dependent methyltransferase [Planctomycetota bacterium]